MVGLAAAMGLAVALPVTAASASAHVAGQPPAGPAWSISKTHTGNFTQGGTGTYTILVSNSGDLPIFGEVTVEDTLPEGLTANFMGGGGWTCTIPALTCTRTAPDESLPPGGVYPQITLMVDVADDAPANVVNRAGVSGGGAADASDEDPTVIEQSSPNPPDLSIEKFHAGNFTQFGENNSYTINVANASGAGPTSGTVTVTDTLPAGVEPASVSGLGWECGFSGQTVTCTRSDALPGAASWPPINLLVGISAVTPCSFTNTATVSGGGSDSASASDPTTVTGGTCNGGNGPDLGIAKTHSGNFTQGGSGTYTVTVSNAAGAGATTGTVTVTDSLPAGVTPTGASGTGWSCGTSGQTVTCTRTDALAAGASYSPITITANVTTSAPCTFTNTATVSGGGSDSASANDPTTVTGGTCNGGNGGNGGGGSILPINLNGIFTMFNNISTNNNINSPGGNNTTNQTFTKTTN